jgi:hypothetical protein
MKDVNTVVGNFNHLHTRILTEHKSKRTTSEILLDLNKEFRRLATAFINDRVNKSSYQVIKLTVNGNKRSSRHVEIRSRFGFTGRLDHSNIEIFKEWAFGEDLNKGLSAVERVNFGGVAIYTVNTGRTVDPEVERLNIRHGIN